jgi:hypothetical protein
MVAMSLQTAGAAYTLHGFGSSHHSPAAQIWENGTEGLHQFSWESHKEKASAQMDRII